MHNLRAAREVLLSKQKLQSVQNLTASENQSAKDVQTCQLEELGILQVSTIMMHAPYCSTW